MHLQQQQQHQPSPIGVLIVDDHDGYRAIASEVVNASPGFVVVAGASSRVDALRCLHKHHGDVGLVLMDVNLGDDDGVRLSEEITGAVDAPDIVLVSSLAFEDLPSAAKVCGARGYLPKAQLSPAALRQVNAGVYDWA